MGLSTIHNQLIQTAPGKWRTKSRPWLKLTSQHKLKTALRANFVAMDMDFNNSSRIKNKARI